MHTGNFVYTRAVLFLWAIVSVLTVVLAYNNSILSLHEKWVAFDQSYSHGYLIVSLSFYWLGAHLYKGEIQVSPTYWAIPFSTGATLLSYFGWATQMSVVEQLSLPFMFYSLLLAGFGWKALKPIILPLLFLLLTIPVWDILVPLLRIATTKVVQFWVLVLQIPAYIDGFKIELPFGVLKIAGGCAGLNFFLVGAVIGVLNAYQNAKNATQWSVYVGAALIFSIAGNWIRVFCLVLIGYYSDMRSPIVYDHGTFGWGIFAAILVLYFLLMRIVGRWLDKRDQEKGLNSQKTNTEGNRLGFSSQKLRYAIPVISVIIVLSGSLKRVDVDDLSQINNKNVPVLDETSWREIASPHFSPEYKYWDRASYWENTAVDNVELSIYTYLSQRQGKEMIYYSNVIADENRLIQEGNLNPDELPDFKYAIVKSGNSNYFVLWTFKIGNQFTSSELWGKLMQFPQSLIGNSENSLVVVSMECNKPNCIEERDFIGNNSDLMSALRMVKIQLIKK